MNTYDYGFEQGVKKAREVKQRNNRIRKIWLTLSLIYFSGVGFIVGYLIGKEVKS